MNNENNKQGGNIWDCMNKGISNILGNIRKLLGMNDNDNITEDNKLAHSNTKIDSSPLATTVPKKTTAPKARKAVPKRKKPVKKATGKTARTHQKGNRKTNL